MTSLPKIIQTGCRRGLASARHEARVGLGQVAEASVNDGGERDVVQRGIAGKRVALVDAAGVLAHGGGVAVVFAVLRLPMAAAPGRQALRAGLPGLHGGRRG